MNISASENSGMAIGAVRSHRFRSLLTILGIVIGITTVVAVASLLTGVRQGVVDFFREMGPDSIFLSRTSGDPSAPENQLPRKERRRLPMKPEYATALRRWCFSIEDAGLTLYLPPAIDGNPLVAHVPGYDVDTINVHGASANMGEITPRDLAAGRFYTPDEEQRGLHVVVLGSSVAEALYPNGQAVGRTVMMDGAEYSVVGVYAKAKGGFFGENGQDNDFAIPLHTAHARYPQITNYVITAKAKPGLRQEAYYELEAAMRRMRRLATGAPNDFSISTPDQIIQQFDSIMGLIGLVAIAVSGLGLLVGGIGVMNIMLVSVTERTREIGVRKALGARRRDIVGQFLVEAVTLTSLGGVLGVILAILTTMLVGLLFPSIPATVPLWALVTGVAVSMAIGVFFGVWPAVKASRLDPVDALRHE